jgi:2-oxoisovalerate dehydrogenase E2 component (dihydrolipoyl transacylase)
VSRVFTLPDLGEGLTEAEIVHWLVAPGDTVKIDQPVVEVETAKSVVEVPSPYAGTVAAVHGAEGETLAVGSPLLEVDDGSTPAAPAPTAETAPAVTAAGVEAYRAEERAGGGSGNVLIGYGTSGHQATARRRKPVASPVPRIPTPSAETGPVAVRSPIVRRLAREHGVDLQRISPTGADGAITRGDVLRATASPAIVSGDHDPATGLGIAKREPLGMLRRTVAAKLSRSRAEIPEATVWVDVDATELWHLRRAMASADAPAPSLTAFLARFALLGLEAYPALGGRLDADGSELVEFAGVNLGIAVDTPRGLMVPVLRGAHEHSVAELDTEVRRVSDLVRAGSASPEQLTGSTFTLNNYGSFGVDGSAAIINHPEVAILGVGRAIERPWVVDGAIVARRILQVSLVFDHRVCDGGYAAGFLRTVVDAIEHPARLFARV